jgi:hypothetical protein
MWALRSTQIWRARRALYQRTAGRAVSNERMKKGDINKVANAVVLLDSKTRSGGFARKPRDLPAPGLSM